MIKRILLCVFCLMPLVSKAEDVFKIRGVLPWHNFMCGPSGWNEKDYEAYLDQCKAEEINFIGFHNYTGGGERYATYVEPMVKISYKHILPQAYFDNSLTSRWGSVPMKVSDFPFGSADAIEKPQGVDVFGSDCSVLSNTTEEQYRNTQKLMQRVLRMSHDRGIRMAMGFEFGVVPPEYFSQNVAGDCFYWLGKANMVPNPRHSMSVSLHNAALDDILETYPDIDYIWLWLNEHSFLGVDLKQVMNNKSFAEVYKNKSSFFPEATTDEERFIGVWALDYIELTIKHLKEKNSKAKLIIGGWGGGNQLPSILRGLDKILPGNVIFSCLNPGLGAQAQPDFLAGIAVNREVWAIPWLEGDHQLWHTQPRVSLMKEQVKLAAQQKLQGVAAIHWRTEETKYNFKTFARFASNPGMDKSVEELYTGYFKEEFGPVAAAKLAPLMADADSRQLLASVSSPEYFAFSPAWGRLDEPNVTFRNTLLCTVDEVMKQTKDSEQIANLKHFRATFEFELLMDRVVRAMSPGWELRRSVLENGANPSATEYTAALKQLESAPVEKMIRIYASKVRSRGEMGVLTSVNQRLWNEYLELKEFLTSCK